MPVISPLFTLRCSVITLAALTYPVAHAAQTPRSIEAEQITKYQFEIPSQALGDALQAFARASRQQLSFDSAVVSGRTSTALLGEFTAEEAIRRLLEGSGLEFRRGSQGVWLIAPERREESAEGRNSARIQLEEIVVTGTNIRGATEVAAPSITVTREDLDKTGYSSIEGLLDDLPQNFAAISFDGAQALESASRVAQRNGVDRASGIDLRGLGAESTLTLVNGTRRAGSIDGRVVDVSVIPLSAIERVEIVTGGRSAIYGSDAVAGVVNLVTRRSFEGAETQVVYGSPTGFGGGEKLQLSQIAGTSGARGSIVAAYDYQRDEPLDLVDTGLVMSPNALGTFTRRLDLIPDMTRHSGFLSGRIAATDRIELYGDVLYANKEFESITRTFRTGSPADTTDATSGTSKQLGGSLGMKADLPGQWQLNLSGTTSFAKNDFTEAFDYHTPTLSLVSVQNWFREAKMTSLSSVASGPLGTFGAVTPQMAIGVERRDESFYFTADGDLIRDSERRVNSAFAEVLVPLVSDGGVGLRRLELSVAGRYDDYEDVGSTFNPQLGVIWGVSDQVTVRGAYSTAFRAPSLFEQTGFAYGLLTMRPDPAVPGGLSPMLELTGTNSQLGPEEAETWSLGLDYQPSFAPSFKASLSYFEIEYEDRLDSPAFSFTERETALINESRFPGLVIRNPSAAQVTQFLNSITDLGLSIDPNVTTPFDPNSQDLLTVFPNLVLFDDRADNIATETLRGLDLSIDGSRVTGIGTLSFGLNATYTLEHERNVTPTSPTFSLINQVGKPMDFRLRASFGWTRAAYGAYAQINYLDGYENAMSAAHPKMDSWTTVDLTLRFDGSRVANTGWLNGFSAALSISNLLDTDPPEFYGSYYGLRYDSTNANPLGRNASLRLVKRW
ncbi:TonB-dependent receptor [Peristeroidobacter soli]|uniref:TonB-dependent receptor n=1 Tax=Peristeroidobacter soli TaxID=2497877 RepID=UPI00101BA925|nr:TonB-dependent receptor [Peristeroidobacter soli]